MSKKYTSLQNEAHLQGKMHKAPHVWTTFGHPDVEKCTLWLCKAHVEVKSLKKCWWATLLCFKTTKLFLTVFQILQNTLVRFFFAHMSTIAKPALLCYMCGWPRHTGKLQFDSQTCQVGAAMGCFGSVGLVFKHFEAPDTGQSSASF